LPPDRTRSARISPYSPVPPGPAIGGRDEPRHRSRLAPGLRPRGTETANSMTARSHGSAERALLTGFAPRPRREETLDELALLAEPPARGGQSPPAAKIRRPSRPVPEPGQARDAGRLATEHQADLLICDEDLSPAQVRNLEEELGLRVIDRSGDLETSSPSGRGRARPSSRSSWPSSYLCPTHRHVAHLSRTGGGIGTRWAGGGSESTRRVREDLGAGGAPRAGGGRAAHAIREGRTRSVCSSAIPTPANRPSSTG
jgi:hypothetical protein